MNKEFEDFFELVCALRVAQKKYFKQGRLQSDLITARVLESRLDKVLVAMQTEKQNVSLPSVSVVECANA